MMRCCTMSTRRGGWRPRQRISETITEIGAAGLRGSQVVDRFDRPSTGRPILSHRALTGIPTLWSRMPRSTRLPDFEAFARRCCGAQRRLDAALDHHARRIFGHRSAFLRLHPEVGPPTDAGAERLR
jgi:hypothetical protein